MISGRKDSTQSEQDSRKTDGLRLTGVWTSFDDIPTSCMSENSRRALEAVDDVSRRIDDLASKLGCLGHFDHSEGPRAA